ncbi:hypothetical protein KMM349_38790 [Stenotrophomonas maltophilia]|nr:hypothetical protein KMM349_38790 [Stenotrophomonas maltophilia]
MLRATQAGLAGVAALAAGAARAGGADSNGAAVRARATANAIGFMGHSSKGLPASYALRAAATIGGRSRRG